jgi:hypothetical protein
MYDKYSQANPITIGSKIPKHKGLLISGGAAGVTMSVQFVTLSGATLTSVLTVTTSPTILPIQVYAVNTLNGMTGFYVN